MKKALGLMALLLLSVCAAVQIRAQKKTTAPVPAADPCKDAYQKGYREGLQLGADFQLRLTSNELSEKEGPIPIEIIVEDIDGSDAFRLAAAEIIRTHFSETLKVEPNASLTLYLGGTKRRDVYPKEQLLLIRVYAVVKHHFFVGKDRHWVPGTFNFANAGATVVNYSAEETTRVVQEKVYKVLSDFVTQWNESKVKAEEPKPRE